MITTRNIRFEDWEAEQMQDSGFRVAVEELEPTYQVARLRIMRGLTQGQLAELVGTKQSSIARLESGNAQPSLSFLRRVVAALGGRLVVQIIPQEEVTIADHSTSTIATDQPDVYSQEKIIHVPNWPLPEKHLWLDHWTDRASAASQ